jgi:hypothetical protein
MGPSVAILFRETGPQEGLHRHACVWGGGGWCPRQQWEVHSIVIVVNVSIIIIIKRESERIMGIYQSGRKSCQLGCSLKKWYLKT